MTEPKPNSSTSRLVSGRGWIASRLSIATRCTISRVPHSGQSGSAIAPDAVKLASDFGMDKTHFQIRLAGGNLPSGMRRLPGESIELELIDLSLGVRDGGIGVRPCEADLERRK